MGKYWKKMSPRWRKFVMIAIVILMIIFVAIRVLYWTMQTTMESMYEEVEPASVEVVPLVEGVAGDRGDWARPITVLMLGVDERPSKGARSDTMMVLALNPEKESSKLLSIPRDTLARIEGYREADKINHAYAFGGASASKKAVEQLLQIPIDYVVTVNMEGFVSVVDAVGGVEVTNPFAFKYEGEVFEAGGLALDGESALKFVRMRFDDPNGDFGRQDRQKNVVKALMAKVMSVQSVWKLPELMDIAKSNVRTNIRFEEIGSLQKLYRGSLSSVETLPVPSGEGVMHSGIYYYVMDTEALETLQAELQAFIAAGE